MSNQTTKIMDIQELIRQTIKAARETRMQNSLQLTLGRLIKQIEEAGIMAPDGKPKSVVYDFGNMYPTTLDSWRGSYEELALGYSEDYSNRDKIPNAQMLLENCKQAVGKVYEGYKGGDFLMTEDTPVWVANYSHSSETAVVGILGKDYELVILTAYQEY